MEILVNQIRFKMGFVPMGQENKGEIKNKKGEKL